MWLVQVMDSPSSEQMMLHGSSNALNLSASAAGEGTAAGEGNGSEFALRPELLEVVDDREATKIATVKVITKAKPTNNLQLDHLNLST